MKKQRVMVIFGTRPEAIKMAPVIKKLVEAQGCFETIVCVTGQHRHMLDQVLTLFGIRPNIDLDLMRKNQQLASLTAHMIQVVTRALLKVNPDLVLVQGDTTTAMVAGLAAFYQKIPVGHVEAGLRTNDKYNPFPEEINRRILTSLATYHFAPTLGAVEALRKENVLSASIHLTGNTVIDALRMVLHDRKATKSAVHFNQGKKIILVTAHRRENFGKPLVSICTALKIIAQRKDVQIVFPVHLNPNVKKTVYPILSDVKNINLIPPVDYYNLACLLKKSHIVLTDSGGIQEEAPAFGKPVFVLRKETERPEGIKAGIAALVGTNSKEIVINVERLLDSTDEYNKMSSAVNPYGDGKASERIVKILMNRNKRNII